MSASKARILIVDDEADLVSVLRMGLEIEGFDVISAADGEEGLRRAQSDRPDLMAAFGDLALIHGGFRYRKPGGQAGSGRYTDVYARRQGRWLCVSAHFNRF